MTIPHYAAIFFAGSRSASRVGRLRNDLDPRIGPLRAPFRGIETTARYGRGESLRETERVGHDPLRPFRETCLSGPLLDLASNLPRSRDQADEPRWSASSTCSRIVPWVGGGPH